jgi:hypothetical protein
MAMYVVTKTKEKQTNGVMHNLVTNVTSVLITEHLFYSALVYLPRERNLQNYRRENVRDSIALS